MKQNNGTKHSTLFSLNETTVRWLHIQSARTGIPMTQIIENFVARQIDPTAAVPKASPVEPFHIVKVKHLDGSKGFAQQREKFSQIYQNFILLGDPYMTIEYEIDLCRDITREEVIEMILAWLKRWKPSLVRLRNAEKRYKREKALK